MKSKNIKNIDLAQFRNRPFRFWFFVMQQKKWFGVAAVFAISLGALLQSSAYIIIKYITNTINNSESIIQVSNLAILLIVALMFMNIAYRISGFLAAWWITHMEMFAAKVSFEYLIYHSAGYFADKLSGKLQSKIFNISRAMDSLTGILIWQFVSLGVKLLIFLIIAFIAHWFIGIAAIIVTSSIVLYSALVSPRMMKHSKLYANMQSEVKGVVVDIVGNILATKQNVALKRESQNVKKVLKKYCKVHFKAWKIHSIMLFFSNSLAIIFVGVILLIAIRFWQQGILTIGDVIMLFTMIVGLYGNLESLSENFNRFMEEIGKLKEGLEEVFITHEIVDKSNTKKVVFQKGTIIFDKVNFCYKEDKHKAIFKNLSLTIPAGQKIGLVGESGTGKSTFVSLLLRFMEVESGSIKIEGHNISKIKQDDLRSAIAYVPQDALLFHRSLMDNIKYSYPKATKKEVEQAAKRAHALDFINSFPRGFKTLIGERGVKLSGGQKQRVMIARAMLKKSPILVLDEATSSLDSKAEKLIQEALEELMKGRTTVAIAHRLSTLKQMDRIIVFDNGKIIEDGTHDELVKTRGKYFELWQHQS